MLRCGLSIKCRSKEKDLDMLSLDWFKKITPALTCAQQNTRKHSSSDRGNSSVAQIRLGEVQIIANNGNEGRSGELEGSNRASGGELRS